MDLRILPMDLVFLFVWFVLFVVNWFWLWFQMSANLVYSPLALG